MITSLIILFVVGYVLIACEHHLKADKSTFALIMCGVLWTVYAIFSGDEDLHSDLVHHLGDTCEILVFLLGAMTIVEHIDRYGGFAFITQRINTRSKRQLLWILSILAFFMSALLDNMTTTIIMVMMLRRLLIDQKERWLFAGVIVIAANSGGAWSPIGDVTTIMLWMKGTVTSGKLILNLMLPCIVSAVIPVLIASRMIKSDELTPVDTNVKELRNQRFITLYPDLGRMMLKLGVAGLVFVPIFKTLTGLPPFMGMMISLGVIWLVTEIMIRRYKIAKELNASVSYSMRQVDHSSIMFFLGILLAVSALQQAGILSSLAQSMNENVHEPYLMTTFIGYLSAVVDNVPLVSACIKMFSPMLGAAAAVGSYESMFLVDGLFWHLLTFTAGVGGSMLIIGSAAGVVAMGIEKIPFFWYLKRISLIAMIGYLAGIATIWLESLTPLFF